MKRNTAWNWLTSAIMVKDIRIMFTVGKVDITYSKHDPDIQEGIH